LLQQLLLRGQLILQQRLLLLQLSMLCCLYPTFLPLCCQPLCLL
jgi:hypothetical protein